MDNKPQTSQKRDADEIFHPIQNIPSNILNNNSIFYSSSSISFSMQTLKGNGKSKPVHITMVWRSDSVNYVRV